MTNSISGAVPISKVLMNTLDFLLSIVGVVAIIGLVISGIIYLTANGDEGKIRLAKAAFVASVIGVVIALGALVLLNQITQFFA